MAGSWWRNWQKPLVCLQLHHSNTFLLLVKKLIFNEKSTLYEWKLFRYQFWYEIIIIVLLLIFSLFLEDSSSRVIYCSFKNNCTFWIIGSVKKSLSLSFSHIFFTSFRNIFRLLSDDVLNILPNNITTFLTYCSI